MPSGAQPLDRYTRQYTGLMHQGRHTFLGVFHAVDMIHGLKSLRPGLVIVESESMRSAFGGGCSVVSVVYDVESDQITRVACNPII
jgi:hypothetical protein